MKRIVVFLAMALMAFSVAQAESEQDSTFVFGPASRVAGQYQKRMFVEPKSERMEVDGYQTRLTVEKFSAGLSQTASDARTRLESVITELGGMFTTFKTGEIASASIGGANGYYCYYSAAYNDGTKDYSMRGRLVVVAHDKDLFQVRLTAPSAWYSYYNHVYRQLRSSFKFL